MRGAGSPASAAGRMSAVLHPEPPTRSLQRPGADARGENGPMTWLLVAVGACVAVWASFVASLVALGRRSDARALATFIPDCIVLVSRLARDRRVPRRRKLLLLVLAGYLASPIDLVPDFVPVAGQLDDAIVVALVLRHLVRRGGEALVRELWPGPESSLRLILRLAGPSA